MARAKITSVQGTAVHVPGDDIDTDRIIPARYLKCDTFDDLAGTHFYDVRFDPDGQLCGDIRDAYAELGFYVFEAVLDAAELADISQRS